MPLREVVVAGLEFSGFLAGGFLVLALGLDLAGFGLERKLWVKHQNAIK